MIRWLTLFSVLSFSGFSQHLIEGRIVDKETGNSVPFASIGILGTSKGTSSNLNGEFSLMISDSSAIKITCIGYESQIIHARGAMQLIQLRQNTTQLKEILIVHRSINPRRVVRRAFANVNDNYDNQPFLQKFFYRHYCKDDSVYGRLIEASVDVWKSQGYRYSQREAGDKEEIRVTQLRRSMDKTAMAQGHEPIAIRNILQADLVAYQTSAKTLHLSFYQDVNNIKADFEDYSFTLDGVTTFDGREVYEISYEYKKDSILTTTGYEEATRVKGALYITTDTYAFVKTSQIKSQGENEVRTSSFYHKYGNNYYPYHLIKEGRNLAANNTTHTFHIELMSVEVRHEANEKFTGSEPDKWQLLKIPYDSSYWKNNTILKTTPLEDKIISDLGGGKSLDHQFYTYQQYELNLLDGGQNGEKKFSWLKDQSKGNKALLVGFWSSNCENYLLELEHAKRLNKLYRSNVTVVLLSLENDEVRWKQTVARYNLAADGIINYRIGDQAGVLKQYKIRSVPSFLLIAREGNKDESGNIQQNVTALEADIKLMMAMSDRQ
jgi:hypothetical protein